MGHNVSSLDTKTKELFLSIAHQWRQPLSEVNSIVSSIDNRLYELQIKDAQIHRHLVEIEKLTKYMSDTIEDFKTEYVEAIEQEHLLLNDIISQSIAVVALALEEKKIKLELQIDTKSSFLYDGKLLKQIILILLNNAKDALLERSVYKPKIILNAHEDTNFFFVSVCDNAGGITKSVREKMFAKHFTTKYDAEGTGLGLFMCKEHIEKEFRGSLSVNNRADGVCFDIKIPKEQA